MTKARQETHYGDMNQDSHAEFGARALGSAVSPVARRACKGDNKVEIGFRPRTWDLHAFFLIKPLATNNTHQRLV